MHIEYQVIKWKEKGGQPLKRSLNARFWLFLWFSLSCDGCWGHFQNNVLNSWTLGWFGHAAVWGLSQLGSSSPSPLVCLLPRDVQESTRGTVLEVPRPEEMQKTFPLFSQHCKSAQGFRSCRLPCDYDNTWISWEFCTALPKHLNVNLRCSTVHLKWLIKIKMEPLIMRNGGRINPFRE